MLLTSSSTVEMERERFLLSRVQLHVVVETHTVGAAECACNGDNKSQDGALQYLSDAERCVCAHTHTHTVLC